MEAKVIAGMGRRLKLFLGIFRDCFGRSEPREHLESYVHGQVSNLHRKSVEPIALEMGTPPRTLQEFLESAKCRPPDIGGVNRAFPEVLRPALRIRS